MKTFELVVEENHVLDREVAWEGDSVPDVVIVDRQTMVLVGRYLGPADRYRYRRATVLNVDQPKIGVVPSAWFGITARLDAEANLILLAEVDRLGIGHDDLSAVAAVWKDLVRAGRVS